MDEGLYILPVSATFFIVTEIITEITSIALTMTGMHNVIDHHEEKID